VTFDLKRGTVTIEGPAEDLGRLFDAVRAAAPALRQISIVTTGAVETHDDGPATVDASAEGASARVPSMRDFARQFFFENTSDRIAVLAYYSSKYNRKTTFSVREMNDWFGLCGFKKPKQMPIAMSDARRKYGYVESKGRDQWALATTGENRVLDLIESTSP
jgi:hypothetical protein